jgi:hypothetical protein
MFFPLISPSFGRGQKSFSTYTVFNTLDQGGSGESAESGQGQEVRVRREPHREKVQHEAE